VFLCAVRHFHHFAGTQQAGSSGNHVYAFFAGGFDALFHYINDAGMAQALEYYQPLSGFDDDVHLLQSHRAALKTGALQLMT